MEIKMKMQNWCQSFRFEIDWPNQNGYDFCCSLFFCFDLLFKQFLLIENKNNAGRRKNGGEEEKK